MNKTDAEIEKALECCSSDNFSKCEECPLKSELDEIFSCMSTKQKLILDYINRLKAKAKEQQEEIERLKAVADAELDTIHDMGEDYERVLEEEPILIQKAKVEAIKEFAERLIDIAVGNWEHKIDVATIDNLVKEMTEKE